MLKEKIQKAREHRNWRSRRKVLGTSERQDWWYFAPRRHIYAQIIDDVSGSHAGFGQTMSRDSRTHSKKRATRKPLRRGFGPGQTGDGSRHQGRVL